MPTLPALAMTFCSHKSEELSLVFVLIAPLQHSIVGEDLFKALIANLAFELNERLHLISCALL